MKAKTVRTVILILLLQLTGFCIIYYKQMLKPPTPITYIEKEYSIDAKAIYMEFQSDNKAFDEKYLNKIVGITGIVTAVKDSLIILNNKIVCIPNLKFRTLKINQPIKIKGRYIGYDELFDNLKVNECIIEPF